MRLSKLTKAFFPLPDDPDKSSFEIKHLLSGDLAEIDDQTNREFVELVKDDSGNVSAKATIDIKKKIKNELTVCKAVTEWKNVFDDVGEPMECNKANKLRLCREVSDDEWKAFLNFITNSRKTLAQQAQKEQEEATGN